MSISLRAWVVYDQDYIKRYCLNEDIADDLTEESKSQIIKYSQEIKEIQEKVIKLDTEISNLMAEKLRKLLSSSEEEKHKLSEEMAFLSKGLEDKKREYNWKIAKLELRIYNIKRKSLISLNKINLWIN